MSTAAALSAQLHTQLLRRLSLELASANQEYFSGSMRPPVLMLADNPSFLGRWNSQARSITISLNMVLQEPWGVVLEVLKHEMAHQYVEEVLHIRGETAHGPAFQHVCKRLGIDAAARGTPQSARNEEEERILRRIGRLLALAESPNENEAQIATQTAQKLMLKYNIDLSERATPLNYGFRQVGPAKSRHDTYEQVLGGILSESFFVRVIWVPVYLPRLGKSATALEINGTDANLEIASYVYDFLMRAGERAWKEYKRENRITVDKERRRFLVGLMMGFRRKLELQSEENRKEGLVLRRDPGLEDFMDRRFPRTRSRRGGSTPMTEAFQEGMVAGQKLVLHKAVGEDGGNRGKLLTG